LIAGFTKAVKNGPVDFAVLIAGFAKAVEDGPVELRQGRNLSPP